MANDSRTINSTFPPNYGPRLQNQIVQDDHPSSLLLVWQGMGEPRCNPKSALSDSTFQVIGDMWESYLRMLDAGIADG